MILATIDCNHFNILFLGLRAECPACGAYWKRQDDAGPWRCVVAGSI